MTETKQEYVIRPATDELFHDALMTYPGTICGANLYFHPNHLARIPQHEKDFPAYIRACQVRNVTPFYFVELNVGYEGKISFIQAKFFKTTPEGIDALIHNSRPNAYTLEVHARDITAVRDNLLPMLVRADYHLEWGSLVLSTESCGYEGGDITADRQIRFSRPSHFGPGGLELEPGRRNKEPLSEIKTWFETLRTKHTSA